MNNLKDFWSRSGSNVVTGLLLSSFVVFILAVRGFADAPPPPYPTMEDPALQVSTIYNDHGNTVAPPVNVNDLQIPIGMVFLPISDADAATIKYDILVLEKNTGKVRRIRVKTDDTLLDVGTLTAPNTAPTVLDLAVNNFSERGLLGIALHPNLTAAGGRIYLYFTERLAANNTPTSNTSDNTSATVVTGPAGAPQLAPVADTIPAGVDAPKTPLLGNRIAWFDWSPTASAALATSGTVNSGQGALTYGGNIIRLRAFQNDRNTRVQTGTSPAVFNRNFNGNHDGGKIAFGPFDKKLYIIIGDNGRRGLMQNIKSPLGINLNGALTGKDDVFGGIAPDNAHFTGVVIRVNDDGTAPTDNPFYGAADAIVANMTAPVSSGGLGLVLGTASDNLHPGAGGEAAEVKANIQKLYAYGIRNSFGLTFDPISGLLWENENSAKSFEEVNLMTGGHNGGWIQMMGPSSRMDGPADYSSFPATVPSAVLAMGDFKGIETLWGIGNVQSSGAGTGAITNTTTGPRGLQQPRFLSAPNPRFPNSGVVASSRADAVAALYMPPGAHLGEPLYSTKNVVPMAGLGFVRGFLLGPQYNGDLISGSAVTRQVLSTADATANNPPNPSLPRTGNAYQGTDFFYPFTVSAFARPEDADSFTPAGSTSNYGHLYRLHVTGDRIHIKNKSNNSSLGFDDPALEDGVADNRGQDDWRQEQSSVLFGRNFGITSEIVMGPDGHLFVLQLNRIVSGTGSGAGQSTLTGRIYMISNEKRDSHPVFGEGAEETTPPERSFHDEDPGPASDDNTPDA